MSLSTFETVENQISGTAKNIAGNTVTAVRQKLSIVNKSTELMSGVAGRAAKAQKKYIERSERSREGVYVLTEEEAKAKDLCGGRLIKMPDGYLRKTPVQGIMVAPDYTARIAKKVIARVVIIFIAVLVIYALTQYSLISF